MREIFRHSNAGLVLLRQSLLESEGIQTYVRNLNTQQTLVEGVATALFPIPEFWPALCIVNEEDFQEATAILMEIPAEATILAEWVCSNCNESIPGHFAECWNCRSVRTQSA